MAQVEALLFMAADFEPERPAPEGLAARAMARLMETDGEKERRSPRQRFAALSLALAGATGGTACAAALSIAFTDVRPPVREGQPLTPALTASSQVCEIATVQRDEDAAVPAVDARPAATGPTVTQARFVPTARWDVKVTANGAEENCQEIMLVETDPVTGNTVCTPGIVRLPRDPHVGNVLTSHNGGKR